MSISAPLRANPFSVGSSATNQEVPYKYPVSLGGRAYMIDTVLKEEWRHETVPLLRQQSDSSQAPGEASLNPEGLWRRSWQSFHKGAGQANRDREESNPFRFRESRGVDVWDRYELKLLNDVDQKKVSSNTNLKLVVCGSRLFCVDGADVTYTEDITVDSPTWTNCTNEPGGTILDIASDGHYVWITDGSNSYWADGTASPPAFNLAGWTGTQDADVLGFVKGRLMSGDNSTATLAYYSAAGVATAVTIGATIPTTGWTWVGFAGGPTNRVIYAAGYAGDKSLIFKILVNANGTSLDAAIVAGELPDGEIIRSIGSYLGFVVIGTDVGVRFAQPDAEGNLTIGALLYTGSPCRCFEGQEAFVWFGWDSFTETTGTGSFLTGLAYTGLGRLSLEEFVFTDKLAPAYATDLMFVPGTACQTSSVVTFQGRKVWTSEGTSMGVFAEEATPIASGHVLTGLVDFGFTGPKTAMEAELSYTNPSSGRIGVQVVVDDDDNYLTVGAVTQQSSGNQAYPTGQLRGTRYELLLTLERGGTTSPVISSLVLKASPAEKGTAMIQVPLLFHEGLDPNGSDEYFDVEEERNTILGWWESRQVVTYRELQRTHTVTVEDYRWLPRLRGDETNGFAVDGTMLLQLKEVV